MKDFPTSLALVRVNLCDEILEGRLFGQVSSIWSSLNHKCYSQIDGVWLIAPLLRGFL